MVSRVSVESFLHDRYEFYKSIEVVTETQEFALIP